MKHIFTSVFFSLMMLLAIPSFAISSSDLDRAGFGKLSATEKAKLVAQVEEQAKLEQSGVTTVDTVSKWVSLGSDLGKGLAGAAKELGVAANEFAQTPVGMMVAGLIVWHFMGGMLLHVAGGFVVWIVGFSFTYMIMRRAQRYEKTYNAEGKVTKVYREKLDDGAAVAYWFANFVVTLMGLFTMFSF